MKIRNETVAPLCNHTRFGIGRWTFAAVGLVLVLVVAERAAATSYTMTNSFPGGWYNITNWSPNGIPVGSDFIRITNGYDGVVPNDQFVDFQAKDGNLKGSFSVAGTVVLKNCALLEGTVIVSPGGVLVCNETVQFSSNLVNAGTVQLTGNLLQRYGGQFINQLGALVDIQCDGLLYSDGAGSLPPILNQGIIRKTGGIGNTIMQDWLLVNSGSLLIQSGTFKITSGGHGSGQFNVGAGAALMFSGACNYTLDSGGVITGAGTNLVNGTLILNGQTTCSHSIMVGGGLGGTNGILGGNWTWKGGQTQPGSSLLVPLGGVLNVESLTPLFGVLTNAGTTRLVGGNLYYAWGAKLVNLPEGLVDIQSDGMIYASSESIINQGTMRKSGGAGTYNIQVPLFNSGIIEVFSGKIALNGVYSMTGGGMAFGVNGPADFGSISISGAAPLTGSLRAILLNGYKPPTNASFQVMTFGSKSGAFTDISGLNVGNGRYFEPVVTTTSLSLVTHATNNPTLTTPTRSSDGCFQFNVTDEFPGVYLLLGSTNLLTWESLGTFTNTTGTILCNDYTSTNLPQRFYRVVVP